MKRMAKSFAAILSAGVLTVLGFALYLQHILPSRFQVEEDQRLSLERYSPYLTCSLATEEFPLDVYRSVGNSYRMDVRLLGLVSVKSVSVQVVDRPCVVPGGTPFGIKMFTDGVMVVGTGDVDCEGVLKNPAKDAGIRPGDIIMEMNGETTLTNRDVARIVEMSGGEPITVTISRDSYRQELLLTPAYNSADQAYRIGLWVRDSSAGIGTMTYYDPDSGVFGGLGHAICDVDTQDIMPLYEGEIVEAAITGVKKGKSGAPGELQGVFVSGDALGSLQANTEAGVFGSLLRYPKISGSGEDLGQVPIAFSYELQEGPATILTTIAGSAPQEYDIMIEKLVDSSSEPTRNMVIRITDPRLLEATGGIVQGMSGSPILQNGRLAGAVTHVFVGDPTKGYGIFVENMMETAEACIG